MLELKNPKLKKKAELIQPYDRSSAKPSWLNKRAKFLLFKHLKRIKNGVVRIEDGDESFVFGKMTAVCSLDTILTIKDNRFYGDVMFGGAIGAAESYMAGYWDVSDLTQLIRIFLLNRDKMSVLDKSWAMFSRPMVRLFHFFNRNTPSGSARNIFSHYDLGNDFFQTFLDPSMTYSCGIFEKETASLNEASIAKIDRICQKLDLQPSDHLLEIGSGWGSFALHAAKKYGCRVTTTTISKNQYEYCREKFRQEGVDHQIELLNQDYRMLQGKYSKGVSIEMIEAVGHQFAGLYFRKISHLVANDGMFLIQAIVIDDRIYERAKKRVDFIKRYIFPGGYIPSVSHILETAKNHSNLRLFHLEDITPHYVSTLQQWRKNFMNQIERIKKMGYPEPFIRMWYYYFCYCEGGFSERSIGDVQMLFTKPLNRRAPILPKLNSTGE